MFLIPECEKRTVDKDSSDVIPKTDDGVGFGFDVAFVANDGVSEPEITYTLKAVNEDVRFYRFVGFVWNVVQIRVYVLDESENSVSPINPKQVGYRFE